MKSNNSLKSTKNYFKRVSKRWNDLTEEQQKKYTKMGKRYGLSGYAMYTKRMKKYL